MDYNQFPLYDPRNLSGAVPNDDRYAASDVEMTGSLADSNTAFWWGNQRGRSQRSSPVASMSHDYNPVLPGRPFNTNPTPVLPFESSPGSPPYTPPTRTQPSPESHISIPEHVPAVPFPSFPIPQSFYNPYPSFNRHTLYIDEEVDPVSLPALPGVSGGVRYDIPPTAAEARGGSDESVQDVHSAAPFPCHSPSFGSIDGSPIHSPSSGRVTPSSNPPYGRNTSVEVISLVTSFVSAVGFESSVFHGSLGVHHASPMAGLGHDAIYKTFAKEVLATRPRIYLAKYDGALQFPLADIADNSSPNPTGERYYLYDVFNMIAVKASHIPGQYFTRPPRDAFIQDFLASWQDLAETCLLRLFRIMELHIDGCLADYLGTHRSLFDVVKRVIYDRLKTCQAVAHKRLRSILDNEMLGFTMDETSMSDFRERILVMYKSSAVRILNERGYEQPLQYIVRNGRSMEYALYFLADVRAYFQVAHQRFIDNVVNAIETELIRGVCQRQDLIKVLLSALNTGGEQFGQQCAGWMHA